jgi:ABC-2 type transport system ATP-binding protein
MISCRSLTMHYGDFCALDHLNLDVLVGEICAMLGPNGAGKSTTLKLMAGLEKPTSGSVTITA